MIRVFPRKTKWSPNVANPKQLTILSLCAGYGGLELGFARAVENPMRVVAVEIEAYALACLVKTAEKNELAIEALYPDLRTFPAERFSGCFDFILAGYPCQPFSVAGKRQGAEDPRHLWPHIARIVQAVRPLWCFFENVPGHLSLGFPEVYRSLRDMGYKVEAGLFTAAEVGASHKRQRLFILADSQRAESRLRIRQEPQAGIGRDRLAVGGEGMADAGSTEHQRRQSQRSDNEQEFQAPTGSRDKWPSRPGQPQYEWEEPRVIVADARKRRRLQPQEEESREIPDRRIGNRCEGQAQPIVGRAFNGPSARVDRLRLLGNGVVPQQAQIAFMSLLRDMESGKY
jgi:DNA (cytosine-5)-methyltransferase 1